MRMTDDGIQRLIKSEGVRYQVYDDRGGAIIAAYENARGYPTIGIGHLIRDNEREYFSQFLGGRSKMTHEQVTDLLRQDLPKYEDPVAKRIEKPVTDEMFDALVSLAFNTGPNSRSVKSAIEAINNEDYQAASDAIRSGPQSSKGVKMAGLVKRRNEEADWFLSGGLPTGIRLFGTQVRALPILLGTSIGLLGLALYIRMAEPEWAAFLTRKR